MGTQARRKVLASSEIAHAVDRVAAGTAAQDHGASESARALEEMAAGIQRMADSTAAVAAATIDAREDAIRGDVSISETIQQMMRIEHSVENSTHVINRVGDRSQDIHHIVDIIAGIVSQTNLLALNASI
ncbi:methyl-accepting chemotaxis protein [Paenibacillus aceris]|uniref:Methyl-accepting chemotaxis protein n=1 Tax=Paenibacillus aceris TaxID=869555 RepID=A0ABS4I1D1_9BACL|nr:methyl-accepting chemotaxis protein [Paenibacillus aceris]